MVWAGCPGAHGGHFSLRKVCDVSGSLDGSPGNESGQRVRKTGHFLEAKTTLGIRMWEGHRLDIITYFVEPRIRMGKKRPLVEWKPGQGRQGTVADWCGHEVSLLWRLGLERGWAAGKREMVGKWPFRLQCDTCPGEGRDE